MVQTRSTLSATLPSNSVFRYVWFSCLIATQCVFTTFSHAGEQTTDSADADSKESNLTAKQADLVSDDVAYLTQLGLLRGHLWVGYELYQLSLPEMAETHMKHPREELYADLIPAFKRRGCAGFAGELSELARVVSARETSDTVTSRYKSLASSIGRCETVAEQEDRFIVSRVVRNLLANALLEYEIGVVDGAINNVHEYQDAWGFTQVASVYAQLPVFLSDDEGRLVTQRMQRLITSLDTLWPSLNPTRIDDPNVSNLLHRLRTYTENAPE